MYQVNMTEGAILPKLLKFSIPLIFSSVLQLLFNAVDVVVVGRFAGENSLAAVGSTGSLINLLVNIFMGLSIGANVIAATYYGSKNYKELHKVIHTSMLLSIISGLLLTFVGVTFTKPILILMRSPDTVLDLSALYLRIYFLGMPASMIYNFGSAILRSKGDTQRPLYILLIAGLINLLLNLIFVINFKMDVAGVATATVISQCISAIAIIIILLNEESIFKLTIKDLRIYPHIMAKIFKIGVPAGFQGIMFSFSNVIIQFSVNTFGALVVAGNSAAMNLEGFVYTSMNGFAQGCLTFCSQNLGAKKFDRIKKIVWIGQACVIIIGLFEGFLGIAFSKNLLSLFSNNSQVIDYGSIRLKMILSTYFLCGIMDVMSNSIRGSGFSLLPVVVSLLGACLLRIVLIAIFFHMPIFHNVCFIYSLYPISWIMTYIAHLFCYNAVVKPSFSL